jgi:hypothetical protein
MEGRIICRLVSCIALGVLGRWAPTFLVLVLLVCVGCGGSQETIALPAEPVVEPEQVATEPSSPVTTAPAVGFSPTAITLLPLTELSPPSDGQGWRLNVFVSLVDAFGSQMKAPGTFRMELYDYVQRSAEPKGQRIAIWPDIDLTDATENQKYWRDFLRAYEFTVPAQISPEKTYVLEVTCIIPAGRRLSATWMLRPDK